MGQRPSRNGGQPSPIVVRNGHQPTSRAAVEQAVAEQMVAEQTGVQPTGETERQMIVPSPVDDLTTTCDSCSLEASSGGGGELHLCVRCHQYHQSCVETDDGVNVVVKSNDVNAGVHSDVVKAGVHTEVSQLLEDEDSDERTGLWCGPEFQTAYDMLNNFKKHWIEESTSFAESFCAQFGGNKELEQGVEEIKVNIRDFIRKMFVILKDKLVRSLQWLKDQLESFWLSIKDKVGKLMLKLPLHKVEITASAEEASIASNNHDSDATRHDSDATRHKIYRADHSHDRDSQNCQSRIDCTNT